MILNKVKIKNFRQFRDVEIEFANTERNFTIIQGNNGTGKTTLLNALSWCLYGEEIHDYKDKTSLSHCNNKTAFLAEEGEKIQVSVEIEFKDESKILTFLKKSYFTKHEGKLIKNMAMGPDLEIYEQGDGDVKIRTDNHYIIDQKIPKEIEEYFFFDGALLGKYFQDNSSTKIKKAIFELSQLNLIENMKSNIKKLIEKYGKDLKKIEPKIGDIQIKLTEYGNQKEKYEKQLVESKNEIFNAVEELEQINDKLKEKNSKTVMDLIKEDEKLKKEMDALTRNINEYSNKRETLIIQTYPVLMTYDYLKNFLEKSEESREKGTIPPLYEKRFIKDLLENGKCICGVDLNLNRDSKEELENVLNRTSDLTDMSGDITKAVVNIENLISEIKNFKPELVDVKEKLKKFKKELNEKGERRKNISSQLKLNPNEEISKLQERKEDLEKIKDMNNRKIGSLESEIKKLIAKKLKHEKQKNEQDRLNIEATEIEKKIQLAEQSKEAIENICKKYSEDVHNIIEKLTKEKFIKIQWKEDEFIDIKINKEYDVYIENKLGDYERPGDLSDGEKLCLGLCFMSALHSISGFDLPIIMDTPLGNLDKDIRQNIAKFYPQFVNHKQVILLVTGTEYTDDFRNILYDHVGKEYHIKWNNSVDGKESKVVLNE